MPECFGSQVLVKRHAERVDTHREDLEGHTVADKTLASEVEAVCGAWLPPCHTHHPYRQVISHFTQVHQLLDMLDVAQSAYRRDTKSAAAHCKLKLQHIVSW